MQLINGPLQNLNTFYIGEYVLFNLYRKTTNKPLRIHSIIFTWGIKANTGRTFGMGKLLNYAHYLTLDFNILKLVED